VSDDVVTLKNRREISTDTGSQALGPMLFRLLCAEEPGRPSARYPLKGRTEVGFIRRRSAAVRDEGSSLQLVIADPYASSRHAILRSTPDGWTVKDEGSTNGTLVDGRRLALNETRLLRDGALLELGHTFYLFRAAVFGEPADLAIVDGEDDLPTLSPEWAIERRRVERLAAGAHELLVEGETGAGKEILARFIHGVSRPSGPFVSINCGALPENLLDDELFGHVKGAFSGADQDRDGLIRAAHKGTVLLDEIGDMPLGLQVKLLRVLEDHKVRPLGSEREIAVDVHVVAATHRNLDALVAQGKFRQDLQARLGLLPVRVPALRERREDLGLLIRGLLHATPGGTSGLVFDPDALRRLLLHGWPLNVRELQRVLLAAATLARFEKKTPALIEMHHLSLQSPKSPQLSPPPAAQRELTPGDRELRETVVRLLREHGGNVAAVARALGKGRTQIQRWVARFGIDPKNPAL
jgi:transcriptional regulator of acetoin/glycerol metabolism